MLLMGPTWGCWRGGQVTIDARYDVSYARNLGQCKPMAYPPPLRRVQRG
jgi:hypothetical protein